MCGRSVGDPPAQYGMLVGLPRELRSSGQHGGFSSVGRAPACGAGGRGFKSRKPPQMGEVHTLDKSHHSLSGLNLSLLLRFRGSVQRVHLLLCVTERARLLLCFHGVLDAAVEVVKLGEHFGGGPDAVLLSACDLFKKAGVDQPADDAVGLAGAGTRGRGVDLVRGHDRVVVERVDEDLDGGDERAACSRWS